MRTNAKEKTKVDTQSPNIGSCFAADPENTKVSVVVELKKLALVNGSDTKLALDGGDQRRPLEKCTSQRLQSASELGFATGNLVMETDNANIFLSCTLLRFNQTSRTVDTDDQASCDLGVQSSTVASLLGSMKAHSSVYCFKGGRFEARKSLPQDPLHPRDDFMTGRVGRLVQVDHTGVDVGLQVTLERRATGRNWCKMTGPHKNY